MSIDARVDTTTEVVQEETPKVVTISKIISHIKEDGMTRDEIRKKYSMTLAEFKHVFSHPKLKGIRKPKAKVMRFQLIDDTEDAQITLHQEIQDREAEITSRDVTPQIDNQSEIQD